MGLSLESLEVLDAIDRRGSFAAAALELDRVPSAITYTVRRLEDEVDALLFDRRGRRAKLTAAGRELLEHGRRLLAEAAALEQRVRRISTGWEAQLRIAIDSIVPMARIWPLSARFYAECRDLRAAHTRLKFSSEVLGGAWDALAEGRVDLVIGASGESPPGGGLRTRLMAEVPMVFAVAPTHPLANAATPLSEAAVTPHRGVVAADSSRRLPPRSVGLLSGQDTLTVPDLPAKVAAQVAGLGCGWLPSYLAAAHVLSGELVIKTMEMPRPPTPIFAAWRELRPGKALAWWIDTIAQTDWRSLAIGALTPGRGAATAPSRKRKAGKQVAR
jgi:DNA-binding transcriptional LysR family regulator